MNYPEVLRARTSLYWFAGVLGAFTLIQLITVAGSGVLHLHGKFELEGGPVGRIPISATLSIAGFLVAILASVYGASLNRYREYGETVMTFPVPRRTFATSVLLTDIVGLAAGFVVVILIGAIQISLQNAWQYFEFDSQALPRVVLAFGAVVLWLALCQAVAAWLPYRATFVAGLSWPVFIALGAFKAGIMNMPGWSRPIIDVLSYLNPLAYLSLNVAGSTARYLLGGGALAEIVAVWTLSFIALAIAVAGWQRQEL